MSGKKRSTPVSGQKSLFSFFNRTPGGGAESSQAKPSIQSDVVCLADLPKTPKGVSRPCPIDEEEEVGPRRKAKQRRVILSDDEEEENDAAVASPRTKNPDVSMESSDLEVPVTPRHPSPMSHSRERGKGISETSRSFLSSFSASPAPIKAPNLDVVEYEHHRLAWLKEDAVKDGGKRRPDHPDYDPSTLYVPPQFLAKLTPAMKQWWDIKAKHADVILLFKVGKFYELYHMDAEVGVRELNLTFMKGNFAHCGFPEMAEPRFRELLVNRGYKVARVEQTETPAMMEARRAKNGGGSKAVAREVCRVTTPGTLGADAPIRPDTAAVLAPPALLALVPQENGKAAARYGICLIDTQTGHVMLGDWEDDEQNSRLRTFLARHSPAQVIYPRNPRPAPSIVSLVRHSLPPSAFLESVAGGLKPSDALSKLSEERYLGPFGDDWPKALAVVVDPGDVLGRTPKPDRVASVTALGLAITYLRKCLIDVEVLSRGLFSTYEGPARAGEEGGERGGWWRGARMVLDGVTLENLRVLGTPGGGDGLLKAVDFTATAMGRRRLRHWLYAPLCDPELIKRRQEAVSTLIKADQSFLDDAKSQLKTMPDLQRALQRIHMLGNKYRSEKHPDSRAIMFDGDKAKKRKVTDLLTVIKGFKAVVLAVSHFQNSGIEMEEGSELYECAGGGFPALKSEIRRVEGSFDVQAAEKEGIVVPEPGADADYDSAVSRLRRLHQAQEEVLAQTKRLLRCTSIKFFGTGRNRFQMEIPEDVAKRVTDDFNLTSQRKGFKRYETAESKQILEEILEAETEKATALTGVLRRLFALFDPAQPIWAQAVEKIGRLDVLMGFAAFARSSSLPFSIPNVTTPNTDFNQNILHIENGYHPCLMGSGTYIPNSITLGGEKPPVMLLTGPNMGGKSTLMRQAALLVILAQVGCPVPAESMTLSPVDRIFTRLGARDAITSGMSTFMVEMAETGVVLREGTPASLVVLDELGRGTGTRDGAAIAAAVLSALARPGPTAAPRTLFSTHFHHLHSCLSALPALSHHHMACMVETSGEEEADVSEETVTFLYKLADGPCPSSYGFHAARLAGLPRPLVRAAAAASRRLADKANAANALKCLAQESKTLSDHDLLNRFAQIL